MFRYERARADWLADLVLALDDTTLAMRSEQFSQLCACTARSMLATRDAEGHRKRDQRAAWLEAGEGMRSYPAKFAIARDGLTVTFRDIPEAITDGETLTEARELAVDALETALAACVDARKPLPRPSVRRAGERMVEVSPLVAAKAGLYMAMREKGVSKAALARHLGCHLPQIDHLLDFTHASRVDRIERALAVLGKRLSITIRDAA